MATIPLIDPATVKPYYINKGLSLELLDKCNAQEFKYIDSYGEGYWLTTSTYDPAGDTITFNKGSVTVELPILSVLNLEHPDHSGGIIAVKTAEPKYLLNKYNVLRNYNVIDPETILITGSVVTYDVKAPDATPKTLSQILTDILTTTPFSLSYSGAVSEVLNVYIEGLSVFDAIERICRIYGFIWTADNSTVYIQTVSPTSIDSTYSNDVRNNANTFHTMNIAFLKMNKCLEGPSQYHLSQSIGSGKGMAVTSYDPYYPAFVNAAGSVVNASDITTRANAIRDNFIIIGSVLGDYLAKHIVFCPALQPAQYLRRTHGDFGFGPRSIFKSPYYCFYPLPEPDEEVCSGSGGRWIQYIITAVRTATAPGADAAYNGLKIATVTIVNASCADTDLIGDTNVDVVDHIGCIFDAEEADLIGLYGIAKEGIALSEDPLAAEGALTPCHWIADDRCRSVGGAKIQYTINSITIAGSTSPYNGKKVATVTIKPSPCTKPELINTTAEVVDWSECVFDLPAEDLVGVWGWASEYIYLSQKAGDPPGTLTPCHWGADDRCCTPADSAGTGTGGSFFGMF